MYIYVDEAYIILHGLHLVLHKQIHQHGMLNKLY